MCFVRPVLEYACPVWHSSLTSSLHDDLEQIQRRATKIMLPSLSYNERLSELGLPTLHERRVELCRWFYKSVVRQHKFHDVLPSTVERPYSLRNPRTFSLVKCRTKRFQDNEGVVSKETVVLRRWGSSIQKFGFINGVDNVNWPPYRDSKS